MSDAAEDLHVDQTKMHVTDEVAIQITDMNKWYGDFHVLRDINLTVNRGERIVIFVWSAYSSSYAVSPCPAIRCILRKNSRPITEGPTRNRNHV